MCASETDPDRRPPLTQVGHRQIYVTDSRSLAAATGLTVEAGYVQLTAPGDYDHVVIDAGNDQVIAAPRTGGVVQIQPLSDFAGVASTVRRFG